jgi:uncharacterized membrane protein
MNPPSSNLAFPNRWLRGIPLPRSVVAVLLMAAAAVALAAGGVLISRRTAHLYLVWNLFLAMVPLVPALVVHRLLPTGGWRQAWLPAAVWLLFLPNAPYILTDFIHLARTDPRWVWGHLLLLVWFSGTGLLAGLVSLRIIHHALARRHPPRVAWPLVGVSCLLAGVGVGLGRFDRWNSWDAFHAPHAVLGDALRRLIPGQAPSMHVILPWVLGAFFALAYLVLWSQAADAADAADHSESDSAGGLGRKNEMMNPTT